MSDLIDREELLKRIEEIHCAECDNWNGVKCKACDICCSMEDIENAPAIDAEPVVHGHWNKDYGVNVIFEYHCSECNYGTDVTRPYCANCGAKMDEVSE